MFELVQVELVQVELVQVELVQVELLIRAVNQISNSFLFFISFLLICPCTFTN